MFYRDTEARELAIPDVGGVASAFNAESARLQRAVGVEPDNCLKLGMVPGKKRTELEELFFYLNLGIWISPAEGEWIDHDRQLHWDGIRKLHPNSAKTVIYAAAVGVEYLINGADIPAVNIGKKIDLFVDRSSDQNHYESLIELCGIDVSAAPDYAVQLQHYEALQKVA